ncbi:MAG: hypothetical protein HC930_06355 [Hydrococcus sp. SU_1_0]|nr:hypothetical protein [Hydrococcus sp. SU_1_0]
MIGSFKVLNKIKNIPHRLRREIYKIPPLQAMKEYAHQKAVDYHEPFLPLLDNQGQSMVDTMRRNGSCIIPLDDLNLSTTEA